MEDALSLEECEEIIRKMRRIKELYSDRKEGPYKDIAEKLRLTENQVGEILRYQNISYGREKTFENLREGETLNPVIYLKRFRYLLNCDIE